MGTKITDERPWGRFEQFTLNERSTVKLLYIKAGKRLSYQYHRHRSEFWHVVSGEAVVTINGKDKKLRKDGETVVPKLAKHRITGLTDTIVLEVAFGKFDENDIIRIEDDFGRTFNKHLK